MARLRASRPRLQCGELFSTQVLSPSHAAGSMELAGSFLHGQARCIRQREAGLLCVPSGQGGGGRADYCCFTISQLVMSEKRSAAQ
uniref:Uncharacterized protein n=1 Tax=Sphaerodactylus townsendi TaxID=933632 RepID=A0ACB8E9K3_9SAUR